MPYRLLSAKVVNHKFALVWDFKITYEMAKNWRKAHNAYLRQNQWKDLTVRVCLDVAKLRVDHDEAQKIVSVPFPQAKEQYIA